MAKRLIREIKPYVRLYRDENTGIAWIEDGSIGCSISIHPNIDKSGSVRGMKKLGYWKKPDRTVRSHGFIYNIDTLAYNENNDLEKIVLEECMCQACVERREGRAI